jgi:hypothetical protein
MIGKDFLSDKQTQQLNDKHWITHPKGQYLTIYRDDFNAQAWSEICHELDAPLSCESVDILYFGVKINY